MLWNGVHVFRYSHVCRGFLNKSMDFFFFKKIFSIKRKKNAYYRSKKKYLIHVFQFIKYYIMTVENFFGLRNVIFFFFKILILFRLIVGIYEFLNQFLWSIDFNVDETYLNICYDIIIV